mmetsp:Transcript_42144/g.90538  ORF Transcript_42144/g.90538 Transcript_42144/m.90538 type:complete len:307 (+) Transcript_42144:124-1044(+)
MRRERCPCWARYRRRRGTKGGGGGGGEGAGALQIWIIKFKLPCKSASCRAHFGPWQHKSDGSWILALTLTPTLADVRLLGRLPLVDGVDDGAVEVVEVADVDVVLLLSLASLAALLELCGQDCGEDLLPRPGRGDYRTNGWKIFLVFRPDVSDLSEKVYGVNFRISDWNFPSQHLPHPGCIHRFHSIENRPMKDFDLDVGRAQVAAAIQHLSQHCLEGRHSKVSIWPRLLCKLRETATIRGLFEVLFQAPAQGRRQSLENGATGARDPDMVVGEQPDIMSLLADLPLPPRKCCQPSPGCHSSDLRC